MSGTHGIEGFCGSAAQIAFLRQRHSAKLPPDLRVLLIHGLNPYGFAALRRGTEENVDLNRNFVDFASELPQNDAYDALAAALCPGDWDGPQRAAADAVLMQYMQRHGLAAFQQAITGGQYRHATGLFYGGAKPSWSRNLVEALLDTECRTAEHMAFLDLHSGLGPFGIGQIITDRANEPQACHFYGEVVLDGGENSPSSKLSGNMVSFVTDRLGTDRVTAAALEFGTIEPLKVLTALRGDAWLHATQNADAAATERIHAAMRAAFCPDDEIWKARILERSAEIIGRAIARVSAG